MHILRELLFVSISSVLLALSLASCGDDGASANDAGVVADGGVDAGGFVCDPVGANPVVGELLNAPVASDVEVIVKEPQHVGNPGPENLP